VGQVVEVVHTLPEGKGVWGVTSLDNEIYVLRHKERDQVEVYKVDTYQLQRCLTVPNGRSIAGITSCEHYHCLYIGDIDCIHRLDLYVKGAAIRWPLDDVPFGLSVNAAHNVIVTHPAVRKIKEFSSHGDLLRELTLPDDVITPRHTIQLRSGQFIVCHGYFDDPIHGVCVISADGRHIVHSHGGQRGSDSGQYNEPVHMALDDNGNVFVLDQQNWRVTLLSPTLDYMREVVSRDKLKGEPYTLHLDVQRRRLYVVDSDESQSTTGRVAVLSV